MQLALIRFKEDGVQREFIAQSDRVLVGRTPQADLQAPNKAVSREHCEIRIEGEKAILRDLGSSNGTYYNEKPLEGEAALEPGDRIGVGPFVFTVRIDGEPEHIEPPLMTPPSGSDKPARDADSSDSDADLSDLLAQMDDEGSSAFEFDLDDNNP